MIMNELEYLRMNKKEQGLEIKELKKQVRVLKSQVINLKKKIKSSLQE